MATTDKQESNTDAKQESDGVKGLRAIIADLGPDMNPGDLEKYQGLLDRALAQDKANG